MHSRKINGIHFVSSVWPLRPDRPTLVFIHGSGGTCGFWENQVAGLADAANTVALDLPGHGESDGPGMGSIKAYADATAHFMEKIALPRPVPCGLSLGSGIVLQLLLDYPERLHAAVLIGAGAKLKVMPAIFETIEKDYAAFIKMTPMVSASPKTDPSRLEPLMKAMETVPKEVARGDFQACNEFDVMGRLAAIRKPVLIVSGTDDPLTPLKYGDYLEKEIVGSTRSIIRDAGHLAPVEKPAEVNAVISAFLEQLKARAPERE